MSLITPQEKKRHQAGQAVREPYPIGIVDNDASGWIAAPYCHLPTNPFGQHTKRGGLWWALEGVAGKAKGEYNQEVDLHEMLSFLINKSWLQYPV